MRPSRYLPLLAMLFAFLALIVLNNSRALAQVPHLSPKIESVTVLWRGPILDRTFEAHVVGSNVVPNEVVTIFLWYDLDDNKFTLVRMQADRNGRFRGRVEFPVKTLNAMQGRTYEVAVISRGDVARTDHLEIHAASRIPRYRDVSAERVCADKYFDKFRVTSAYTHGRPVASGNVNPPKWYKIAKGAGYDYYAHVTASGGEPGECLPVAVTDEEGLGVGMPGMCNGMGISVVIPVGHFDDDPESLGNGCVWYGSLEDCESADPLIELLADQDALNALLAKSRPCPGGDPIPGGLMTKTDR